MWCVYIWETNLILFSFHKKGKENYLGIIRDIHVNICGYCFEGIFIP